MFGYVTIDKPNILIKDYQTYRSYYCGICKTIGKRTGNLMRLTLNYDIVLLALFAYNYENAEPVFKTGRCPVHWLKKVEYVERSEILERVSDVNTVLGYYKAADDVIDEGKRRVIKLVIKGYYNKARKRIPDFAEQVKKGYEKLRELEKARAGVEVLGEAFGQILMKAGDAVTDKCDAKLRELLFWVGKWIYTLDAMDDLKEDCEKRNFNPFLRDNQCWNDTVWEKAEEEARVILYDTLERIRRTYDEMNIGVSEGALSNVIYLGLKSRTEKVLEGRGKKCQKIRL